MIHYSDLTPLGRGVVAMLGTLVLLLAMAVVGAIETSEAATATDSQCDAMYHAIWAVQENPSHTTLFEIATEMGCPFND